VAVGTVKWFNDEKGWGSSLSMASPTSLCTTRRFKEKVVRRSSKVRPLSLTSSRAIEDHSPSASS